MHLDRRGAMMTSTGVPTALSAEDFGFGRLFWLIRDAVIVGDASTGRIVLWNPAAEALFGYTAEEAVGMSIEALIPEKLRARHQAGLACYNRSGVGSIIGSDVPVALPALRKDRTEIA